MPNTVDMTSPIQDKRFHSYETHHIPWYVRGLWVGFWVGAVWYLIKYAIPMAKRFYQ